MPNQLQYTRLPTGKVEFSITGNAQKTVLGAAELTKLLRFLQGAIELTDDERQLLSYAKYYRDYSPEKVRGLFDEQEATHRELYKNTNYEYRIYGDYCVFLPEYADNDQTEARIRKDYVEAFGTDPFEYDSERDQFNSYSKDRALAEQFEWWLYERYVKPVLDKLTVEADVD